MELLWSGTLCKTCSVIIISLPDIEREDFTLRLLSNYSSDQRKKDPTDPSSAI